jgi:prepilin-type N-terminal cleavage/methylation domain-containing protein
MCINKYIFSRKTGLFSDKAGVNMPRKIKNNQAFTLIELLVVIAIIGLLSTLSLVALNNARQKARDTLRAADIKQMMTALELYYNDLSSYPASLSTTTPLKNGSTTFMGQVPQNPKPYADGWCSGSAAVDFSYNRINASSYEITYCLAGGAGNLKKGTHKATPNGIANP